MHEFSATTRLVETVLQEAKAMNARKVLEVNLIVGKLTFLRPEQMRFAYQVLTEKTMLEGSELNIEEKNPVVKCPECSYHGPVNFEDDPAYHLNIPTLSCPKCHSTVEILRGRECNIRSIRIQK